MSRKRRTPDRLGTVERLPSGNFRASYRHEGRKYSAPVTFPTKEAARAWLTTERADRLRGTWRDPHQGRTTLAEFANGWLDSRTDLAPGSSALYRRLLDRWILAGVGTGHQVNLAPLSLDQVSPAVVRRWFAAVSDSARESATQNRTRAAARTGQLNGHPARAWARVNGLKVAPTGRLSPDVLDAWRDAGEPDVAAPATALRQPGRTQAAQAYRLLRTMFSAAVQDGLVTDNPCTLAGAGAVRAAERPTATPAEVQALAAAMPERYRAAVLVAAWSGLRRGELLALTRRDVDTSTGALRVVRSQTGLTKTRGSVRTVFVPRFVADVLARHIRRYALPGSDSLVFPTSAGGTVPASHLATMFGRARQRVGRPDLTWHDLRHTGATLAYAAGASVREVQRRLGHTTTRAAMIYAHAADDSDRLLADRLNVAYGQAVAQ